MSVPIPTAALDNAANTLPKYLTSEAGVPVLGPSGVTDDGTTLKYKGVAVQTGSALSLTTTGTSGPATLEAGVLNVPTPPTIQKVNSAAYTITSDNVTAGFVDIPVTWPAVFSSASYSIAYSVLHSGVAPAYDVAPADISISSITVAGFTAGVYLNSGDSSLIGDTVVISAIGVYA